MIFFKNFVLILIFEKNNINVIEHMSIVGDVYSSKENLNSVLFTTIVKVPFYKKVIPTQTKYKVRKLFYQI